MGLGLGAQPSLCFPFLFVSGFLGVFLIYQICIIRIWEEA